MYTVKGLADRLAEHLRDYPELADVEVEVWIKTGKTYRSYKRTPISSLGWSRASGQKPRFSLSTDLADAKDGR